VGVQACRPMGWAERDRLAVARLAGGIVGGATGLGIEAGEDVLPDVWFSIDEPDGVGGALQ
jgi:hypothetical protein